MLKRRIRLSLKLKRKRWS